MNSLISFTQYQVKIHGKMEGKNKRMPELLSGSLLMLNGFMGFKYWLTKILGKP